MEVGVCAEAYQGGEPLRHINSAFMTFEVLDHDKKPRTLPHIRPEPVVRPQQHYAYQALSNTHTSHAFFFYSISHIPH